MKNASVGTAVESAELASSYRNGHVLGADLSNPDLAGGVSSVRTARFPGGHHTVTQRESRTDVRSRRWRRQGRASRFGLAARRAESVEPRGGAVRDVPVCRVEEEQKCRSAEGPGR